MQHTHTEFENKMPSVQHPKTVDFIGYNYTYSIFIIFYIALFGDSISKAVSEQDFFGTCTAASAIAGATVGCFIARDILWESTFKAIIGVSIGIMIGSFVGGLLGWNVAFMGWEKYFSVFKLICVTLFAFMMMTSIGEYLSEKKQAIPYYHLILTGCMGISFVFVSGIYTLAKLIG